MQSLNVLVLSAPRFFSVALTCFSSLYWALNAKWWGDKTLSIKTCFMTTWDSWPVLQRENIWGFEAKVSLRDLTANLTWLSIWLQDSRSQLQTFVLTEVSIKTLFCGLASHPFLCYSKTSVEFVNGQPICRVFQLSMYNAAVFLGRNLVFEIYNRPVHSPIFPGFLKHNHRARLHAPRPAWN